ncbi:transmembrane amino acid transporter protein-domain-containing protein [Absidia repens]|uniref:Transmembrane amino acid transporter protein-domain-containing protein n=1 Tax=Absidia repens TaxID=90262 RepID=A0A1X2I4C0_9FUNG|nr:transmembrane amino acid transporter protein-domain-containing protein [Absidia repens]
MDHSNIFPNQTRVPTNTHPSQLPNYGTVHTDGLPPLTQQDTLDLSLYRSHPEPGGASSSSLRNVLGSFGRLETESVFSNHTSAGLSFFPALSRHTTLGTVILRDEYHEDTQHQLHYHPQSTFLQSVFNSVNVLVGIGAFALPLGIRYAGWLVGISTFLFCTISTNYSAKVLARCLDAAPYGAITYADMGAAAFGERGRGIISGGFTKLFFFFSGTRNGMMVLEKYSVAMAILLGDGLETLFDLDLITTRLISFCVLTPMTFLPISKLAYTSVIGVVSSMLMVAIVVLDGLTKPTRPGSLWDPVETEWIPSEPFNIPLSFGLLMAVYSGHAVFPSLYRDMAEPKKYDRMVDTTYLITFTVYLIMAVSGYMMFGLDTMQEITKNLAQTPGYTKWMNQGAVYLIVFIPVAKYGLMLNPVNLSWEIWLQNQPRMEAWYKDHTWKRHLLSTIGRIALSAFVIYIATVFPGFDRIMSLLGALFSFGISVIFPLACYHQLYSSSMTYKGLIINWMFLIISLVLAILGTVWSCFPSASA